MREPDIYYVVEAKFPSDTSYRVVAPRKKHPTLDEARKRAQKLSQCLVWRVMLHQKREYMVDHGKGEGL